MAEKKPRKRITLQVSDGQYEQLQREAGNVASISELVRSRVFGRGINHHPVLREVAALHAIGRRLQLLLDSHGAEGDDLRETLALIRARIASLAGSLS